MGQRLTDSSLSQPFWWPVLAELVSLLVESLVGVRPPLRLQKVPVKHKIDWIALRLVALRAPQFSVLLTILDRFVAKYLFVLMPCYDLLLLLFKTSTVNVGDLLRRSCAGFLTTADSRFESWSADR